MQEIYTHSKWIPRNSVLETSKQLHSHKSSHKMKRRGLNHVILTFLVLGAVAYVFVRNDFIGPVLDARYGRSIVPTKPSEQACDVNVNLLRLVKLYEEREKSLQKKIAEISKLVKHINPPPPSQNTTKCDYKKRKWVPGLPVIYAITPTYTRWMQKAELTRIAQTFLNVPNFHWIVVEDSERKTRLVGRYLRECGLKYTHLNIRTSKQLQRRKHEPRRKFSRGLDQRNIALDWLRKNVDPSKERGVVYFADDDNTYDIRLFEEMRWTKVVSIWPVGFTGGARWAGPTCKDNKVIGFYTNWEPQRAYPIDMAGFAISTKALIQEKPEALFILESPKGYVESLFLEQVVTFDQLEPRANCSKIYVWHTRSQAPKDNIQGENELIRKGRPSNPMVET